MNLNLLESKLSMINTVVESIEVFTYMHTCNMIDYDVFKEHVYLKLQFLRENADAIKYLDNKEPIERIMQKCTELLLSSIH